jgi:hypothetical protein
MVAYTSCVEFTCDNRILLWDCGSSPVIRASAAYSARTRLHVTNSLLTTQLQIYVCCAMWCELFEQGGGRTGHKLVLRMSEIVTTHWNYTLVFSPYPAVAETEPSSPHRSGQSKLVCTDMGIKPQKSVRFSSSHRAGQLSDRGDESLKSFFALSVHRGRSQDLQSLCPCVHRVDSLLAERRIVGDSSEFLLACQTRSPSLSVFTVCSA